jgi:hypothetical protein
VVLRAADAKGDVRKNAEAEDDARERRQAEKRGRGRATACTLNMSPRTCSARATITDTSERGDAPANEHPGATEFFLTNGD